jgi:CRISPR-associated endoribonuclease Cas6
MGIDMRIKLVLKPVTINCIIPINYQYPISSIIYNIISSASKNYADWLHNKGYIDEKGKPHKLFVFSNLIIKDKVIVNGNSLKILKFSPAELYISSPMFEDFVQNFIFGLFQNQSFNIYDKNYSGELMVEQVETLHLPEFKTKMKFRMLSPVIASTMKEYKGKLQQYYYRPNDEDLSESIRKGLIKKYELINHRTLENPELKFSLDEKYIESKGGYEKISKLTSINKNNESQHIKVKSFIAPFTFEGNPELIRTAYECGIGEKNSIGFGMIEV